MRLWHKELIPLLPREQLVSQWRELSAIATSIRTKDTPNHILVNEVMNYPFSHFYTYAELIRVEMDDRGYITRNSVWENIVSVVPIASRNTIPFRAVYEDWHNKDYLTICYYNLYEKYLCGGIPRVDFEPIEKYVKQVKIENEL